MVKTGFLRGSRSSKWGCRLVWSRLGASGALDPGSNPGSPTIFWLATLITTVSNFVAYGVRGARIYLGGRWALILTPANKNSF